MKEVYLLSKCFLQNPGGEFLVLKRSGKAPIRPSEWDIPGGMLEPEENPNVAVLREIKEETNIILKNAKVFYISTENTAAYILTFFYSARITDSSITISDEHSNIKWVSTDEFRKLKLPEKFMTAISLIE